MALCHSHEKRKDRLEGSLVRVLFAVELEFSKILAVTLSQNASNVNITPENQTNCIIYAKLAAIHGCSSSRKIPGA